MRPTKENANPTSLLFLAAVAGNIDFRRHEKNSSPMGVFLRQVATCLQLILTDANYIDCIFSLALSRVRQSSWFLLFLTLGLHIAQKGSVLVIQAWAVQSGWDGSSCHQIEFTDVLITAQGLSDSRIPKK